MVITSPGLFRMTESDTPILPGYGLCFYGYQTTSIMWALPPHYPMMNRSGSHPPSLLSGFDCPLGYACKPNPLIGIRVCFYSSLFPPPTCKNAGRRFCGCSFLNYSDQLDHSATQTYKPMSRSGTNPGTSHIEFKVFVGRLQSHAVPGH